MASEIFFKMCTIFTKMSDFLARFRFWSTSFFDFRRPRKPWNLATGGWVDGKQAFECQRPNGEEPWIQSCTSVSGFDCSPQKQNSNFLSKLVNFESTYLGAPMEFGRVLGHFRYLREQSDRFIGVLDDSNKFSCLSAWENVSQISKFSENRVHFRKRPKFNEKIIWS